MSHFITLSLTQISEHENQMESIENYMEYKLRFAFINDFIFTRSLFVSYIF